MGDPDGPRVADELRDRAVELIDELVAATVADLRRHGRRDEALNVIAEGESLVQALAGANDDGRSDSTTPVEADPDESAGSWSPSRTRWVSLVRSLDTEVGEPGPADSEWFAGVGSAPSSRVRVDILRSDAGGWTPGYPSQTGKKTVIFDETGQVAAISFEGTADELEELRQAQNLDPMAFGSQTLRLGGRTWMWWHDQVGPKFPFADSPGGA